MTDIVSLETARLWEPSAPEDHLIVALGAACDYVRDRCRWAAVASDGSVMDPPGAIVQAVKILTTRYLARRNSPEGILGMDDLGAVRIPGIDRDVETLIQPYRRVVFG